VSHIAYLINEYPKVSHSFIRREILALERQGFAVERIALHGWDGVLVDDADRRERERTRYLLRDGVLPLLGAALRRLLETPRRFVSALRLAIRMRTGSERPLLYHLAYFAEACRLLDWLRSARATHLHAHFGTNSAEVAMLAHALGGPPYSFTVHGQEEVLFGGIGEKVRRAAFVVAISSYGRSQLYRRIPHTEWRKVEVVHCGLEADFLDGAAAAPPSAPRLVCIGRLLATKGQLLLVEAAHRLATRGIDFELVLAGDGEMRDEVQQLIERHGLQARLRITGWISSSQVREELLASRGLVLPSFVEGLPVVIMEAMALRRPVLSTYISGIPELVLPGTTGWLVPAGSIDELTRAMEEFLRCPAEQLLRMGEAARERVLARHSVDTEAGKLAQLFLRSAPAADSGEADPQRRLSSRNGRS
jgi:colanic acid/amylovoran biosynthesis glycosyltransferase